jgi:hypothetical protein
MVVSGHNIELLRRVYYTLPDQATMKVDPHGDVPVPLEDSQSELSEASVCLSRNSIVPVTTPSCNRFVEPPSTALVSVSPPILDILLDTYGIDPTLGISLSQDSTDKEAQLSMERLVTALLANSPLEAGEVLRSHLLLDTTLKLRVWKPMTRKLYYKCTPDGTCGYQFMYQMYLRGLHKVDGEQFPTLCSSEHLTGYKDYLQDLVTKFGQSLRHSDEVEQVKVYLKWLDTPVNERNGFQVKDWLTSEAVRKFAAVDSPLTFVTHDPSRRCPVLGDKWG